MENHDAAIRFKRIVEKLRKLPPERLSEIEDFVDFIKQRAAKQARKTGSEEDILLTVWDHPEDAVYD